MVVTGLTGFFGKKVSMASNREISATEKLLNVIRGKGKAAPDAEPSYKPVVKKKKKTSPLSSLGPAFQRPLTIGVDVGHQALQMVKVEETAADQWRLADFRRVTIPAAVMRGTHEFNSFLKSELGKFCGTARGLQVWNLIHSSKVDVRFIKIPKVPRKQLENAIYWTAKRELAFEDLDTILDFEVGSDVTEQGVKKTTVMVYTAPRREVESLAELFRDIGYPLSGLTIAPFAIQNLFRTKWMPTHGETLASLFIGRDGARIDIYSAGSLILTREIKAGMNSMVESLIENYASRKRPAMKDLRWGGTPADFTLTVSQASKLILSLDPDAPALTADDPGHDLSEEDIFEMIRPALDRLVRQVERTFANLGGERVSRVYISGVVNAHQPLIHYVGEQLGIESGIMNPLDSSPPFVSGHAGETTTSEKASLAVAMGLALSDNARTPNLLFTYKEKEKMATVSRVNRAILISLVGIIITGLTVFAWQERIASKKKEAIAELNQQLSSLNLMVDSKLILQMAAKDREERRQKKEYGERYLGMAVLSELSALTPENIRFLKIKTSLGRPEGKGVAGDKGAEKGGTAAAKPAEIAARTLEIDGIVLGQRSMLEGYLSSFVLKLKGSPLFKEATVQKSTVETLPQNRAEGEVLHFVLNLKL